MEILLDYRVIYTTNSWWLTIVAWLKYSDANTANTTDIGLLEIAYLVDILTQIQQIQQINTELLKIVAWLKYSRTNTADTANTMAPIIGWLRNGFCRAVTLPACRCILWRCRGGGSWFR
jgi:hypothetical protein